MNYSACKSPVGTRGIPPDSFLDQIVDWAKHAPDSVFAPNKNSDIYSLISAELGPFSRPDHHGGEPDMPLRRASMLEVMRVHAGFESSWNWNEGVDITNQRSMSDITAQETGIFQVSYDSLYLGGPDHPMKAFADICGIVTPKQFIDQMKSDHVFALDYYARLIRVNIKWAGPLKRREINPFLKRSAVAEFRQLLS